MTAPIIFDHINKVVVVVKATDPASVGLWQRIVAAQVRP